MLDNHKKTSTRISRQIPEFIREYYTNESGDNLFVLFIQAYYEWAEQTGQFDHLTRNAREMFDVDSVFFSNTFEAFKDYFFRQFLPGIPKNVLVNKQLLFKHGKEFYLNKGSDASFRFLFRVLYNDDISVFVPSTKVLTFSDPARGIISGDCKIHDSYFWQQFSYQISSEITIQEYREIVTNLLHPAGMRMFGKFLTEIEVSLMTSAVIEMILDFQIEIPAFVSSGEILNNGFGLTSTEQNSVNFISVPIDEWDSFEDAEVEKTILDGEIVYDLNTDESGVGFLFLEEPNLVTTAPDWFNSNYSLTFSVWVKSKTENTFISLISVDSYRMLSYYESVFEVNSETWTRCYITKTENQDFPAFAIGGGFPGSSIAMADDVYLKDPMIHYGSIPVDFVMSSKYIAKRARAVSEIWKNYEYSDFTGPTYSSFFNLIDNAPVAPPIILAYPSVTYSGSNTTTVVYCKSLGLNFADDSFLGLKFAIVAGTGVNQISSISAWDNQANAVKITLSPALSVVPDTTSEFVIFRDIFSIIGSPQAAGASTITLSADEIGINDFYNNIYKIKILYGPGKDEEFLISDYNGSTKVATIDGTWSVTPTTNSVYFILKNGGNDATYFEDYSNYPSIHFNELEIQELEDQPGFKSNISEIEMFIHTTII